jgi:hypothetical protein
MLASQLSIKLNFFFATACHLPRNEWQALRIYSAAQLIAPPMHAKLCNIDTGYTFLQKENNVLVKI